MSDFNSLVQYTVENISRPVKYIIYKLTEFIRVVDKFIFRQVPAGAASGYANIEKVEGNTVAWNQLLKSGKLVDMGLPSGLLWATCNIDITQEDGFAANPFQYECSFFSWGNIDGHNPISNNAFDYNWGSVNAQEPWYEGQVYGSTPGSTLTSNIVAGDTYDAARYNLGSLFKMPTSAQFQELFSNCDFVQADGTTVIDASVTDKRVTVNGCVGIYLKSKVNGNLIFFSASGIGNESSWNNSGTNGLYWSSSLYSSRNARYLSFYIGGVNPQHSTNRYYGVPIRAVVNPNTIDTGHNNHKYYVTKDINHDLTTIFGSGNEPTTVAEFEEWMAQNGLPSVADYNAGELLSVKMESVKSIGFNQWDEELEVGKYIGPSTGTITTAYPTRRASETYYKCIPNTDYFVGRFVNGELNIANYNQNIYFYKSDKTFISSNIAGGIVHSPQDAYYFRVASASSTGDICINISDPSKNGTYQPYKTDSADIDVTTITGINTATNVRETIFPQGMKQADRAGTVKDILDLRSDTATVKCLLINLGTTTGWTKITISGFNCYFSPVISILKSYSRSFATRGYLYKNVTSYFSLAEKEYAIMNGRVYIRDTSQSSVPSSSNNWLDGVIITGELATPITYTDLQDANGNPLNPRYKVEQGGTEQVLPVNTSTPTTVAPTLTTTYTKDVH